MTYDVFITHTTKDQEWAKALCERLESKGMRCFIACRDVPAGKLISAASMSALAETRVLMVVYTRNYSSTPQMNREIEAATSRGIPVLTVGNTQCKELLGEADRYAAWVTSLVEGLQATHAPEAPAPVASSNPQPMPEDTDSPQPEAIKPSAPISAAEEAPHVADAPSSFGYSVPVFEHNLYDEQPAEPLTDDDDIYAEDALDDIDDDTDADDFDDANAARSPMPSILAVSDRDECYRIAECYYHGQGTAQDFVEAANWYEKAAKMGHPDAQCDLGNCYYYGEGRPEDLERSVYWYEKAAELGNSRALYNLGNSYFYGEGVPENTLLAISYYDRAADLGSQQARQRLDELGVQS